MDCPDDPPLPLAGFRVLDLTRFPAGPYAAMVLADLGADVVKVEQTVTGDDSRNLGPFHESGRSFRTKDALGAPHWLSDPRFAAPPRRTAGAAHDKHPEAGP